MRVSELYFHYTCRGLNEGYQLVLFHLACSWISTEGPMFPEALNPRHTGAIDTLDGINKNWTLILTCCLALGHQELDRHMGISSGNPVPPLVGPCSQASLDGCIRESAFSCTTHFHWVVKVKPSCQAQPDGSLFKAFALLHTNPSSCWALINAFSNCRASGLQG